MRWLWKQAFIVRLVGDVKVWKEQKWLSPDPGDVGRPGGPGHRGVAVPDGRRLV